MVKSVDAVQGLPRSPDVAKVVDTRVRQAELQAINQSATFAREMSEKSKSVSRLPKASDARVDTQSSGSGGGGGGYSQTAREKKKTVEEKETSSLQHPSKGKILDIRGA